MGIFRSITAFWHRANIPPALEEKIQSTFPELSVKLAPRYNEDRRVIDVLLGVSIT